MRDLLAWDAVINWRDSVFKKNVYQETKINYLRSMVKLIERGNFNLEPPIFNISQPLKEFIEGGTAKALAEIEKVSEWAPGTRQYRRSVFTSFYKFAKKEKIKQTDISIPFNKEEILSELFSSNENKAKSQCLGIADIVRFLEAMWRLNPRDFLICWMMWEFKRSIHEALDLTIGDINFNENAIFFDSRWNADIRAKLKRSMLKQCEGKAKENLLFTTGKGNRVHPGQLVRNMKTASKLAALPIVISPIILTANAKAYKENILRLCKEHEKKFKNLAKSCKIMFRG